ncbi:MAG: division/cell wall cluster transcriptional repressor MraZ [Gammaproteobacteria bacterium]|nr:division/cell wall cluster transcriptional repressor MraZ [Gammaproteobacteria bacterium]
MFRGVTSLSLDTKGRMAMPAKYRDRLQDLCGGQLVITVDRDDRCLLVYPLPEWEEIERKLAKLPSLNKQARRLQRLLIGHATECELDGAGRILLPPKLREYAGLDKQVMLLGQVNKFELWDEQVWNAIWSNEEAGEEGLSAELESLSL